MMGRTDVAVTEVLVVGCVFGAFAMSPISLYAQADRHPSETIWINGGTFRLGISADGRSMAFVDIRDDRNHCDASARTAFAQIKVDNQWHGVSGVEQSANTIVLSFLDGRVTAKLRAEEYPRYLTLTVLSVDGPDAPDVEALTFIEVPLTLTGAREETFAACPLALNIRTDVKGIPQPASRIRATAYTRFGIVGSAVAVVGCPTEQLRDTLKQIILNADGLPHSTVGGPWAMDTESNYGSYLMDLRGEVVEDTVDDWIAHCHKLGITQLDFHTGRSLRFGDYEPNPELYPDGYDSVRRVIDKLHAAGIKAGLHTYSQFIAKDTPWVTPVPDRRLAKARTLTLAADLTAEATSIPVLESTAGISPITGFHVRNSATIQIDDELIVFRKVSQSQPFAFQECERGALGTKTASHQRDAKVHHLKQCYGLFVPDPDTTLYSEVAARTAEAYNRCGFDMIYLDAIDGSDIFAGWDDAWHYSARFVYDLAGRLEKPALFEMSMFLHHLWCVRSRMGAWDIPARGPRPYIDMHTIANESGEARFMPTQLGWWGAFQWNPVQPERTFPEVMDYICCKCIGYNSGLALLVGFSQDDYDKSGNTRRLAEIVRRYEKLRLSGAVPAPVREKLRAGGDEFALEPDRGRDWQLRPVEYLPHKVVWNDERTLQWSIDNRFDSQPLAVRIEALMSAGPYDAPSNPVLADFENAKDFEQRHTQPGAICSIDSVSEPLKTGTASGRLTAHNKNLQRAESWALQSKRYSPYLDMVGKGLGVWVHGDGQGEILNLQLQNPPEHVNAFRDSYITVDFEGWRYFELIEPESDRIIDYTWPYSVRRSRWLEPEHRSKIMGYAYPIYHFWVSYPNIEWLNCYVNNVPRGRTVNCYLSPIRAIPLVKGKVVNPSISVAGRRITFPVELESGQYLEFHPPGDGIVYDAAGEQLRQVPYEGELSHLATAMNELRFECAGTSAPNWRTRVTVVTRGEPIWKTQLTDDVPAASRTAP
jgi:hypothetical protein